MIRAGNQKDEPFYQKPSMVGQVLLFRDQLTYKKKG